MTNTLHITIIDFTWSNDFNRLQHKQALRFRKLRGISAMVPSSPAPVSIILSNVSGVL